MGINTGEAVVALGARPEEGEGIVTGDVVNTASRLQGAAPVNGVAVSKATHRATERIFDFEPMEPVTVKGKSEPLILYRPVAARARFGSEVTRSPATPLVGRELEKPLLIGTFERAAQQQSCQLVTVVGEPGVGKSRLCMELFQYIEERARVWSRWRQGRCLPYGEGIAFWALGEIVKAECGNPGVGLAGRGAGEAGAGGAAGGRRGSALAIGATGATGRRCRRAGRRRRSRSLPGGASWRGWRRSGPAVVVFEDLHWADPALLAFLEHLADWAEGVPLLVLCTARPELHEQHPGWAAGLRNAHTINLAPLSDQETAQLVSGLLERAVLPSETQQALLERAGGNPLYAEEFVRLLSDRGESVERVEVPESVQALIAARLDTLSPERKGLLQDAAVMGKVFWAGARGGDGRSVTWARWSRPCMSWHGKELVRPSPHLLDGGGGRVRLLARAGPGCLLRPDPARRPGRPSPKAAAAWIEAKAGERVEDLADVLAHHYVSALELSSAAGQRRQGGNCTAGDPLPGPRRRAGTGARRRPGRANLAARSNSRRQAVPSGQHCWSGGDRRCSSRDGCRRHGRRSRRRSSRTGNPATTSPPAEH